MTHLGNKIDSSNITIRGIRYLLISAYSLMGIERSILGESLYDLGIHYPPRK